MREFYLNQIADKKDQQRIAKENAANYRKQVNEAFDAINELSEQ